MLLLCFWNDIILWRHSYLMQSYLEISGARHKRVKNSKVMAIYHFHMGQLLAAILLFHLYMTFESWY